MRKNKIVDIPYSQSAVLAEAAPEPMHVGDSEHLFLRLDVISRSTATGGLVFVASSPQFPSLSALGSDKNSAIFEILERLPEAFWEEKKKSDRGSDF